MFNKIKILYEIIRLQFKIWKLDVGIWCQEQQFKNNDNTYTQACLKCGEFNQYDFHGFVPEKHSCHYCGNLF